MWPSQDYAHIYLKSILFPPHHTNSKCHENICEYVISQSAHKNATLESDC